MPQMAPMNWLTLFIMFSMYVLVFSSMNYFFFMKTPLKTSTKIKININNWLW
uniref:ATP synthase complex subunit 8 n=1 Tax=Cryptocephalus obliteratifer TaxID=1425556 RepID=A0A3G1GQC0_9CUCU|nr:ATP synthase F0 subunit 8 [Cryptocephalus obliteratifer]